ncbi:MAG TPA: NAD(P)H-binding protein [Polyangiaceae bacterium]|nr:NAD(P)H-binding protein [Polyangiaceae bacterium]
MKVVLFGATGMVGQGVLRECLLDPDVEVVLTVGRSATGKHHEKLRELVHADLFDLSPVEDQLAGYDACFFCLGVSSAGMSEADYRHLTYDLTLAAARTLAAKNPAMTFVYVSGAGTDATGRSMWARVKGETENALLALPFKAAFMFRPGGILPVHGERSRTRLYRIVYAIMGPLHPLWKALIPNAITTSERLGKAMLAVAKHGAPKPILETRDINAIP